MITSLSLLVNDPPSVLLILILVPLDQQALNIAPEFTRVWTIDSIRLFPSGSLFFLSELTLAHVMPHATLSATTGLYTATEELSNGGSGRSTKGTRAIRISLRPGFSGSPQLKSAPEHVSRLTGKRRRGRVSGGSRAHPGSVGFARSHACHDWPPPHGLSPHRATRVARMCRRPAPRHPARRRHPAPP